MRKITLEKIRRFPAKLVKQTGTRLKRFYRTRIIRDVFEIEVRRWFADKGDETLRLNYDLGPDSVVFDLGGYRGDFAAAIFEKYGCNVYVFEPAREFFEQCEQRFAGNDKIRSFNFGLGEKNCNLLLSTDGDASSTKTSLSQEGTPIEIRQFDTFFNTLGVPQIDLIKINIEGGEFDVLPHLSETGLIRKIRNIQVQFHTFVVNAKNMRKAIRASLAQTHKEDWCYTFVWENWSLK